MARYIDAEELLNKRPFTISGGKPCEYLEGFLDCVDEAKEAINNTPTADVAEVKHGYWKECFEDWRKQIAGDECSVCGFQYYGTSITHYNYCPNCGAKMDRDK